MKRPGPLRSEPAKVWEWQQRSRRPLPSQSEQRLRQANERAVVRLGVLARDERCQVEATSHLPGHLYDVGPCFGRATVHHRRKASQSGGYNYANLVRACQHHNDALEADAGLAHWAHGVGLVVRRGDPEWELLG